MRLLPNPDVNDVIKNTAGIFAKIVNCNFSFLWSENLNINDLLYISVTPQPITDEKLMSKKYIYWLCREWQLQMKAMQVLIKGQYLFGITIRKQKQESDWFLPDYSRHLTDRSRI